jgi:hypothetical protein
MRNVDKAIEWMEKQSKNPSQSWKGLCQSTCRQAYSMGPFGSSARDAWGNVNKKLKTKNGGSQYLVVLFFIQYPPQVSTDMLG